MQVHREAYVVFFVCLFFTKRSVSNESINQPYFNFYLASFSQILSFICFTPCFENWSICALFHVKYFRNFGVLSVLQIKDFICSPGTHIYYLGKNVSRNIGRVWLVFIKKVENANLIYFWVDVITIYINNRFLKFCLIW